MAIRTAEAQWEGDLKNGKGSMKLGSGAFEGRYSVASRMEEAPGTNPEELLGAAHAGCFSMALAAQLSAGGFTPKRLHTRAKVHFGKDDTGFAITRIELATEADVPGIDDAAFQKAAEQAKTGCPLSKALKAVPIELRAELAKAGA
jgi:lipoyl-dependent peroxiredoxin